MELSPEIERHLAGLSDTEWSALSARLRAPDTTEQLRTAAGKVLSGDALESFMALADVSKFADEHGQITENTVIGKLTAIFGGQQQAPVQYGQHSGGVGGPQPGDRARSELAKRYGTQQDTHPISAPLKKGQAGRDAAAKRFGTTTTDGGK